MQIPDINCEDMTTENGILWASDYWSANVYQQAANTFKDYNGDGKKNKNSYGFKGDDRWQQIALSEGWANYREEILARKNLGLPNYTGTGNSFLYDYLLMFRE